MATEFTKVKTITSVIYPIFSVSELSVSGEFDSILERPDPTVNPVVGEALDSVGVGFSYEDVVSRGPLKENFDERVSVGLAYSDIESPTFHSIDSVGSIGVGFTFDDVLFVIPPSSNLDDSIGVGFVYDNIVLGS